MAAAKALILLLALAVGERTLQPEALQRAPGLPASALAWCRAGGGQQWARVSDRRAAAARPPLDASPAFLFRRHGG